MQVIYKEVQSINDFIDAIRIRADVFIVEQKCQPGWEPDDLDKESRHFIAIVDGKIVSTARARKTGPNEIKIERMATKKEFSGKDISKGLVKYHLKELKELNPKRIWMESQLQAKGFYEQVGFKVITKKPYDLWGTGIFHVEMEYTND